MSSLPVWTFSQPELEEHSNQVKDLVLRHLQFKGYLSTDDATTLALTWQIVVKKPSSISRLYKKLMGKDADEPHLMVVRHERLDSASSEEKKDD